MRLFTLRPHYFTRRVRDYLFQRSHPGCPWLSEAAVLLLDNWLKPTDHGFEWGSGRSTVWIGRRVSGLVSVEDDAAWHARVRAMLARDGVQARVDNRLIPCEHHEQAEPASHPYADAILEFPDGHFDFVLVDGNIRLLCMQHALEKLKPGGLLILDNANRYVPNRFEGTFSTVHEPRAEPRTPGWGALLERLRTWRWLNSTNGIWDTRFWVKPLGT